MILFESDYTGLKPENFDINTKNQSFIKTWLALKRMGIKNNKFFLYLHDPELAGIDPHNLKDDSEELKLRIGYESKVNPWYVFREVFRIVETGGNSRFLLNRANLAMIWLFLNSVDEMIIMPRQLGKTISSLSISALIIYITGFNTSMGMLTKDDKLRRENVARLKDIRDGLPKWMVYKQIADSNNSEGLSYSALNNKYLTFVAQSSKMGAEGLGRGLSLAIQHWDEMAFFANIATTYPVALNSTIAAIRAAKKNNQLYGNMITTTAGELNTESGKYTHDLLCSSLLFTEFLYDTESNVKLKELVKANSKQGMVYCEFSYRQLGMTDEWFQETANRSTGTKESIERDLLNIWSRGGGLHDAVSDKYLKVLYKNKRDPLWTETIDGFIIRWYLPKDLVKSEAFLKIPIVMGTDSSENIGKDSTTIVMVDARNMKVVGVCSCNTVNIIKVALFIATFLYNPNFLFIPERNSTGSAIVDTIIIEFEKRGINPFKKIYNNVIQDRNKYKNVNYLAHNAHNDHRGQFGWRNTGSKSMGRTFLYNTVFFKALDHGAEHVYDRTIVNEIAGLVEKNGRIDHAAGGHDDHVIAYTLCCFLLFWGENLQLYEFLSNGKIDLLLCELREIEDSSNAERISNKELSDRIAKLHRSIKSEKNVTLRVQMKQQLMEYEDKLPKDKPMMIDDVKSITELSGKNTVGLSNIINTDSISNFFKG